MVKCKENEEELKEGKEKNDIWPGQIKDDVSAKHRMKWKEAMEFMFQDTVESKFNVQHFSGIIKQTTTSFQNNEHV